MNILNFRHFQNYSSPNSVKNLISVNSCSHALKPETFSNYVLFIIYYDLVALSAKTDRPYAVQGVLLQLFLIDVALSGRTFGRKN